jgi:phosphoheptose isomerase
MTDRWIFAHVSEHQAVVARSFEILHEPIAQASTAIIAALSTGHKIIAFGNGGSATAASHLAGELLGRYSVDRRPYSALALGSDPGVVTCIANDFGFEELFSRQLAALSQPGDVAIGFTTSGKSENVRRGLRTSLSRGVKTIALTGAAGLSDCPVNIEVPVPSAATAHIQEVHLMVVHIWCKAVDELLHHVDRQRGYEDGSQ